MRHCTLALLVASLFALTGTAAAQTSRIVVSSSDGSFSVLEGVDAASPAADSASDSAVEGDGEEKELEETERSKKLKGLVFDRRSSAILAAWAKPSEAEPEPYVAAEEPAEAAEEGAQAEGAEATPEEAAPAAEGGEPEPEGDADAEATAEEGAEGEATDEEAAAATEAAKKAEKEAKEAKKAAEKAAKEREKAEEKARKKAEAEHLEWELAVFQRNVSIGDWDTVASYLAGLEEVERIAGYEQMLASLVAGPKKKPSVPQQGRAYVEVNQFSSEDVLGLVAAAPLELEKKHLEQLGKILAQSTKAGHQIEGFLGLARAELDDEGEGESESESESESEARARARTSAHANWRACWSRRASPSSWASSCPRARRPSGRTTARG